MVSEGQGIISPSCCCGLEDWREWRDFLETEDSPWLGHDPSPWIERQGKVVRVWSDESVSTAFNIEIPLYHFEAELIRVEQEIQAFLFRIEGWVEAISFVESSKLVHKFDEYFNIRRRYKSISETV